MASIPISREIPSVSVTATLQDFEPIGLPARFAVAVDEVVWHFAVHNHGDNLAVLGLATMISVGPPDGLPVGGLGEKHLRPPVGAIRLAIEREMREIWADESERGLHRRLVLILGGFTGPPPDRKGTQGRRRVSPATRAVRARRALKMEWKADEEKALTEARKAGVLHRPPRSRTFTPYGRELLDRIDVAKKRLLRFARNADRRSGAPVSVECFLPQLLPRFTVEIVDAAIDDLCIEGRITPEEWATPADRQCHGLDYNSIRFRRACSGAEATRA